jgi:hypothetical protein
MIFEDLFGLNAALPSAATLQSGIATQAVWVLLGLLQATLHRRRHANPVVLVILLVQQLVPPLKPDLLSGVGPRRLRRQR